MKTLNLTSDDKQELIEALRQMDYFSDLTVSDLSFVANNIRLIEVESGTILIKEGEKKGSLYIIREGEAVVKTRKWFFSPWQELERLGPDQFFGEMAVAKSRRRSAHVVTSKPSKLFVLEPSQVEVMIENNPPFRDKLYKLIHQREDSRPSIN